jgi:cation diffusion facilitator CzcD-associated flavoprotein CzcO
LINTDTIIIGAGPAGISLASLLSKEDVPFLLLEKSYGKG